MRLERPRLAAAALVGAAIALCPPAFAQSSDPAAADALFRKGREAAEKGDWATACPKFAESQRLDPAPGTLLNLADCEEHLGALATAYEHFKTALETMAPSDDRVPFARQHMNSVEKKVPHLTLNASAGFPANARVMRDEVQLGSASFGLALPVDPGTHAIVVTVPGRADRKTMVTLKAGDTVTIELRPGDADATAPASAVSAPVAAPETAPPPSGDRKVIGVVLGSVGVVGIGVGAVAGVLVLGKKSIVQDPSHCDQVTHACDQTGLDAASQGKTLSVLSPVAFAAGGAALAAGVILLLTGGSKSGSASSQARATLVAPDAYPGGAGLRVIGSF